MGHVQVFSFENRWAIYGPCALCSNVAAKQLAVWRPAGPLMARTGPC